MVAATVGRDVAFGPENVALDPPQIWARVADPLPQWGSRTTAEHASGRLSGGEGQRLALAGALALRPGLLLLDEPTAMLDAASADDVRRAVLAAVAATGSTLVVVEHRLEPWVDHVDRLVVLSGDGAVIADGAPARCPEPSRRRPLRRRASGCPGLRRAGAAGRWSPGWPVPWAGGAARRGAGCSTAEAVGVRGRLAEPSIDPARRTTCWPSPARAARASRRCSRLSLGGNGFRPAGRGRAGCGRAGSGPTRAAGVARAGRRGSAGWLSIPEQGVRRADRAGGGAGRAAGRRRRPGPARRRRRGARADGLLAALGLTALAAVDPYRLSGGEQRRLAVAAALAQGPQVLLLDEPTLGQDRLTWAAVAGRSARPGRAAPPSRSRPMTALLVDAARSHRAPPRPDSGRPQRRTRGPAVTSAGPRVVPDRQVRSGGGRRRRGAGRWPGCWSRCSPSSASVFVRSLAGRARGRWPSSSLSRRWPCVAAGRRRSGSLPGLSPRSRSAGRPGCWAATTSPPASRPACGSSSWSCPARCSRRTSTPAGWATTWPSACTCRPGRSSRTVAALQRRRGPGRGVGRGRVGPQGPRPRCRRARRSRGCGRRRALTFVLLVQTVRSAGRMAVAMDARGFAGARPAPGPSPRAGLAPTPSWWSSASRSPRYRSSCRGVEVGDIPRRRRHRGPASLDEDLGPAGGGLIALDRTLADIPRALGPGQSVGVVVR